jgi:hypothetical protein
MYKCHKHSFCLSFFLINRIRRSYEKTRLLITINDEVVLTFTSEAIAEKNEGKGIKR